MYYCFICNSVINLLFHVCKQEFYSMKEHHNSDHYSAKQSANKTLIGLPIVTRSNLDLVQNEDK